MHFDWIFSLIISLVIVDNIHVILSRVGSPPPISPGGTFTQLPDCYCPKLTKLCNARLASSKHTTTTLQTLRLNCTACNFAFASSVQYWKVQHAKLYSIALYSAAFNTVLHFIVLYCTLLHGTCTILHRSVLCTKSIVDCPESSAAALSSNVQCLFL